MAATALRAELNLLGSRMSRTEKGVVFGPSVGDSEDTRRRFGERGMISSSGLGEGVEGAGDTLRSIPVDVGGDGE